MTGKNWTNGIVKSKFLLLNKSTIDILDLLDSVYPYFPRMIVTDWILQCHYNGLLNENEWHNLYDIIHPIELG